MYEYVKEEYRSLTTYKHGDYKTIMLFKDKKRDNIITCPVCGQEYLPAEIFIPSAFFGHPEDIDRTNEGKIEAYDGTTMDLTETYVCDKCGAELEVEALVKFKVQEKNKPVFDEEYSSPLYASKISLFEGDDNLVEEA